MVVQSVSEAVSFLGMPGRKPGDGGRGRGAGAKDDVSDLLQLVIAYAKQETLDPVVRQLKTVGKGLLGAVLLALGTVLLALGFLRALQAEFGGSASGPSGFVAYAPLSKAVSTAAGPYPYGVGAHLSGDWSWVPYMGGALFCIVVAGFSVTRIMRRSGR